MRSFRRLWYNAEFEFHDPDLNGTLTAFKDQLINFVAEVSRHTFPWGGRQKLYPTTDEFSDRFVNEVEPIMKKMDEDSTALWKLHQRLVKDARERLGV